MTHRVQGKTGRWYIIRKRSLTKTKEGTIFGKWKPPTSKHNLSNVENGEK